MPPERASAHELPELLAAIGNTPLVPLRSFEQAGAPVWVKCEHQNPGGSVKDRIALSIVRSARECGALRPGQTLIEATAGNTGIGLALVGAVWDHAVVCVMPEKMSVDKRIALEAMGARVIITPNAPPDDPENFQHVARRLSELEGWYLTDQFANPANIAAHEEGTGPELLEQTCGRIAAFVAGAGTGGTLTGVARSFRARSCDAQVVLADPEGSRLAHWARTGELGPDGAYAVEGIGSSVPPENLHRDCIDQAETITDEESFAVARQLIAKEGLHVGGSAGTAVAAALRVASRLPPDAGPVVALLPDRCDRYMAQPWLRAR